jgi:outer membrane protein assembly factor BamB
MIYLAGQDGKLVVVDLESQKQLWSFQTVGSRQNLTKFSKPDGTPDYQSVFASFFYDDMVIGVEKMHSVGMILTSPVISGNAVYIGSTDGNLYALE